MSEILDVAIEKLVYGGDGLARADGRVVLIPFVLPGERVRARVTKTSGSFVRAEALEILTPAAARETAACPYFRRCGGCQPELNNIELGRIKAAPSDEVIRCEECSRILVRTPESGL